MTKKCPIQHAKSYPFDIPKTSYALGKDGWTPLGLGMHETENRHAVLAWGSTASPQRLARKFHDHCHLLDQPVYVTHAHIA